MSREREQALLATRRQNYRYKLALLWVRAHRPDVLGTIEGEIDKKYPTKLKRDKANMILPEALRDLQ